MGSIENNHTTNARFGTLAVHAGAPHDPTTGAVIAPVCDEFHPLIQYFRLTSMNQISLSTTFAQTSVGSPVGLYEYTRSSNPNR